MSEQLFTLADAKLELARQDCAAYGHTWRVVDARTVDQPAGLPIEVVCDRCTVHYAIVSTPTVDEPLALE
ncbi:hypothetical protein ACFFOS_27930 [Nocardioides kongjuensis]|uniref:Uncharacterized protein n=1 Tax=Nocardioides kongjuensis TaxID=349522 RepID=A0A852RXC4_9ACTN|nr:hypothetical protein [Nocardioides kongjuensis]NYD33836.1 hypothetical protein [Nocardioides kongjuensis]